jgi:sugar lactone lactonase YvrE
MKSTSILTIVFGVAAAYGQAPPAAPRTGPGVQAPQDAKYQDLIKTCKVPPPAAPGRGGAKGGPAKGQAKGPAPAETGPKDVTIMAIPGVIAAGQQWKEVWKVEGNNADGIVATKDGGLLLAQNDNSNIVKLDKNGKISNAYTGLNTSGSVAMNGKYLFGLNRGLNQSIEQLEPQRKTLASKTSSGDPLDCLGGTLNDMTADSKGGVYFTMGTVYHADAKGTVTKYGENLNTNGIVLSPDEKHLFVTNGATVAEFDVQKDGSLTNQREFAKLEGGGGGDGSTFDSAGRLYVTAQANGIQVFSPDGKYLGVIPTPRPVITVTFSGPDRKTLYAVSRTGNTDWIIGIQMIAQGPKGRGK